jgi:hypothetical protein
MNSSPAWSCGLPGMLLSIHGLWDGGSVHYTVEGTAIQSKQVAQAILPWLPVMPTAR